jgi:hypothetical protein
MLFITPGDGLIGPSPGPVNQPKNESTHPHEPTPHDPNQGDRLPRPTPRGTKVARAGTPPQPSRHAPIESIDPARLRPHVT